LSRVTPSTGSEHGLDVIEYPATTAEKPAAVLVVPGVPAGLNGPSGLMRQKVWSLKKDQAEWHLKVRLAWGKAKRPKFERCEIIYRLHVQRFWDWENAASSFKHIGDALKKIGCIPDDSPKYILRFTVEQERAKQADRRVEIVFFDRGETPLGGIPIEPAVERKKKANRKG
jgi:hypothetical protein